MKHFHGSPGPNVLKFLYITIKILRVWSNSGRVRLELIAIGAPNYSVLNNIESFVVVLFYFTKSRE